MRFVERSAETSICCILTTMELSIDKQSARKVLLSGAVVGCVAVSWALSTQFSHVALKLNPENFNAPYCLMWFNTAFMVACYPVFLFTEFLRKRSISKAHQNACKAFSVKGFSWSRAIVKVGPFLLMWIAANYSYAQGLVFISASVATAISSCNAAIVYTLSILFLKDRIVKIKILSVVIAIAGVAVISLGRGASLTAWIGVLLAVTSATSAAFYKVFFKKVMGSADLGQVALFMTVLGTINVLFNWIPGLLLVRNGVELIKFDSLPWAPLIGSGVLSLLFNFSINFGIALLHPLVVSVGMLMGIPLNAIIDVVFRDVYASIYFISGTLLIFCSFVLIIIPDEMFQKKKSPPTDLVE